MSFQWHKGGVPLGADFYPVFSTPTNSFLSLTNLQPGDATNYAGFVSNITSLALGGPLLGWSSNASLTILPDTDFDGLPDDWESAHPEAGDRAADYDQDGMSNAAEWFAGTDPLDPASFLAISLNPALGILQFTAVSNRTYSVQFIDGLAPARWRKLADVLARSVSRVETLSDPNPGPNRYYRVVTPVQRWSHPGL